MQGFQESPFGGDDHRRKRDKVSFEAAFSHTGGGENALGDYTFELAIPLRGNDYCGVPIDLDNTREDMNGMGILVRYYDAKVNKDFPSGEFCINNVKFTTSLGHGPE
jgi:hypothetical protein